MDLLNKPLHELMAISKAQFDTEERKRAELATHKETCIQTPCRRCERYLCRTGCGTAVSRDYGICHACFNSEKQAEWTAKVQAAMPRRALGATLDSPWLVKLVGIDRIKLARESLAAERVACVGPPGAGKTSLVAAMFQASQRPSGQSPWPAWYSAHELAKARALHALGEGEAPVIWRALQADLLVIDELGGEDERYASAVKEILYERHAACLPTWVTTGVGSAEIGNRYGGGIARRVFEDAVVFKLGAEQKTTTSTRSEHTRAK